MAPCYNGLQPCLLDSSFPVQVEVLQLEWTSRVNNQQKFVLFLVPLTSLPAVCDSFSDPMLTARIFIYSDLLLFTFGLTSKMKVVQMVCNHLLSCLLCAQFDSTWEKDVPFPASGSHTGFMRYPDIRYMNDVWKHHRLLTISQI